MELLLYTFAKIVEISNRITKFRSTLNHNSDKKLELQDGV